MVYSPEVRGAHRRTRTPSSSRDNLPKDAAPFNESMIPPEMDLEELRSDAFERSYAIRWLTVLLHYAESNITNLEQFSLSAQEVDAILQDAASLLAICSGTAAAGTFTRTFSFQLPQVVQSMVEGETDIKVQLKDIPLDNHDFSSVGAQTWGGACVLAELIVERPRDFGVGSGEGPNPAGTARKLKILELGAGTGLVSITLGKLYQVARKGVEIVATDFYSSVLRNLQDNIDLNLPSKGSLSSPVSLTSHFLDWSLFPSSEPELPFNEPFDIVVGTDIVYEAQHAVWIKACLVKLLRRPQSQTSSALHPLFHLVIPLRPTHLQEAKTVEKVFLKRADILRKRSTEVEHESELAIYSMDTIACDTGSGFSRGEEEVEYVYYKIGWC